MPAAETDQVPDRLLVRHTLFLMCSGTVGVRS